MRTSHLILAGAKHTLGALKNILWEDDGRLTPVGETVVNLLLERSPKLLKEKMFSRDDIYDIIEEFEKEQDRQLRYDDSAKPIVEAYNNGLEFAISALQKRLEGA